METAPHAHNGASQQHTMRQHLQNRLNDVLEELRYFKEEIECLDTERVRLEIELLSLSAPEKTYQQLFDEVVSKSGR